LNAIHRRYDCCSFNHANRKEDEVGLYQSANWMHDLITKEELEHGIPSNRIIIGGISQGGGTATLTALTAEKPLAGLFSISSYVPLRRKITEASFYTSFYHPKYLKSLVSRSQLNLRRKSQYFGVTERKTVRLISSSGKT
jgi:predicted esterase